MSTLSDYNNNPGNLKPPKGVTYEGQIGVDDKGFAIFENKSYGQQALVNDLTYKLNNGVDTPEKFVNKYSPAGDENSEESRDNYKLFLMSKFGLKSSTDPFPKDAVQELAKSVSAFEGGTWASPEKKQGEVFSEPPVGAPEREVVVPTSPEDGERLKPVHRADIPGVVEQEQPARGVIGAGIGTGIATTGEAYKKLSPLVPNVINALVPGRQVNPTLPQSRASLQSYLNSQISPNLRLPLSELERVSGAEKIRTMSEVQSALKSIQAEPAQRIAKVASINPSTGTPKKIYTSVPGRPAKDLSKYERVFNSPVRQAVSREFQTAGEVARSLAPSATRVGFGALGGANAMMTGFDAWEMAQKLKAQKDPSWVDWARLASKSAATLGGGLSMVPAGWTQILGGALQAPEAAWSLYDYSQKNRNQGALPYEESPEAAGP